MPDDIKDIQAFYDKAEEQEGGRLERHQLECDITWRYLDKYLRPEGSILEIGAATGVYTIPLAKRGYCITAVDLSPGLIEICRKRVADEGLGDKVTCNVADARNLGEIKDNSFDAVLMMGPLYHLVEEEDRRTALVEAYKKLKPGGTVFSTFISRYGIWGEVMNKLPDYIKYQNDVKSVLEEGRDAELAYQPGNFRAYFSNVIDIMPLHEQAGFRTVALAGVEPAGAIDSVYNNLQGEIRRLWLDLLFSISTEKSLIGASCHLLYVGEKGE